MANDHVLFDYVLFHCKSRTAARTTDASASVAESADEIAAFSRQK